MMEEENIEVDDYYELSDFMTSSDSHLNKN